MWWNWDKIVKIQKQLIRCIFIPTLLSLLPLFALAQTLPEMASIPRYINSNFNILKNPLSIQYVSLLCSRLNINCDETAGQKIFYWHLHLIPKRKGDVVNPRGDGRNIMAENIFYADKI